MINDLGDYLLQSAVRLIVLAFLFGGVVGVAAWESCQWAQKHIEVEVR